MWNSERYDGIAKKHLVGRVISFSSREKLANAYAGTITDAYEDRESGELTIEVSRESNFVQVWFGPYYFNNGFSHFKKSGQRYKEVCFAPIIDGSIPIIDVWLTINEEAISLTQTKKEKYLHIKMSSGKNYAFRRRHGGQRHRPPQTGGLAHSRPPPT
jgi:hypothetical protein